MSDDYKLCPYCGEDIKARAIKCKHCHTMLEEKPAQGLPRKAETFRNDESSKLVSSSSSPVNGKSNNAWMIGISIIVIAGILLLIGFSINKIFNQRNEETLLTEGPTIVETGDEAIDTWVNASNFLTSKTYGLYTLHGEFLNTLTVEDSFQDITEIKVMADNLRAINPPVVLQDLFERYLIGVDLLEESAKYAHEGDWGMASVTLDKGSELTLDSLEIMSERVIEEMGKLFSED